MNMSLEKDIKLKSKKGFASLMIRSLLINVLQALSVFLLTTWLLPKEYGIFAILNGYVAVSYFFCDIGIGGALVQQEKDPTKAQLQSCAFLQMGLALIFTSLFWILAPFLSTHHNLGHDGVWMMRCLALSIPINAARGVPKIFIDRKMSYKKSGMIDLIEAFATYSIQIIIAGFGGGAWSFIAANLCRAIFGTLLYLKSAPRFYFPIFSYSSIKDLLGFGFAFQANAFIPALKGLIIPVILGSLLSVSSIGLISWSLGIASIPSILAINFNQVSFAALSRLSEFKDEFSRLAQRNLELSALGISFIFSFLAVVAFPIVTILFPSRWHDTQVILPLAIFGMLLYSFRYLCASVMNASGIPGKRLKIESIALVLEFFLTFITVKHWGIYAYFITVIFTNFLLLFVTIFSIKEFLTNKTMQRFLAVVFGAMISITVPVVFMSSLFSSIIVFLILFFVISGLISPSIFLDIVWLYKQLISVLKIYQKNNYTL